MGLCCLGAVNQLFKKLTGFHLRDTTVTLHLFTDTETHTDGADKVVEETVGEEGLRQLSEEHLQGSCGHVDVLPLPV